MLKEATCISGSYDQSSWKLQRPWEFTALAETQTGNMAKGGLVNRDPGHWQLLSLTASFMVKSKPHQAEDSAGPF